MLVKFSDMLAFQAAGAELEEAGAAYQADPTNTEKELAYQLANMKVCSFFCGQYVGNTLYVGGTLHAGFDLSESFLDGTQYTLDNLAVGSAIKSGTTPVATVENTEIAGYNLLTFKFLIPGANYNTVSAEGSTHLNFYLMNGMAIVLDLYAKATQ